MATSPQRWLVCRTDALGDSLLALPVATAIKRLVPGSHVTFLSSAYTQELLAGHPDLDQVLAYAPETEHAGWSGLHRLIRLVAENHFDAALLVFPDPRVSWAVFWAGVRQRVGTGRRLWSCLYTRRASHSRRQSSRHEAEYNLDLLRALGLNAVLEPPIIPVRPEAQAWAQEYLQERGLRQGQRLVIVHPGGRGSAANWPLEQYQRLVDLLLADPNVRVLVTGAGREQEENAAVFTRGAPQNSTPQAGARRPWLLQQPISLPQLAALLAQADVVVAGNTGPAHLAAALARRVVALYPAAGKTGPVRWRPLASRVEVLTLDRLEPEAVAQAVQAGG
jgi:heptosyltransferase III